MSELKTWIEPIRNTVGFPFGEKAHRQTWVDSYRVYSDDVCNLMDIGVKRNTVTEICLLVGPSVGLVVVGVVVFALPTALLGGVICGVIGLGSAVASGRSTAVPYALLNWPRPQTDGDLAVNGIAYNGVLVLGVVIGHVIWTVSKDPLLTGGASVVLPVWFLKHVRMLAFLDEG